MKLIIIIILIIGLSSCQKSKNPVHNQSELSLSTSNTPLETTTKDHNTSNKNSDNFNLKQVAGCNSEEEIQKKLNEEIKKAKASKAFKLQGNSSGCTIKEKGK